MRKGWDENPATLGSKSRSIRLSRSHQDSNPTCLWFVAHHQRPAKLRCPLKAAMRRIGSEFSNRIIQHSASCAVVGGRGKLVPEGQGAWSNVASGICLGRRRSVSHALNVVRRKRLMP
jgi:hypothetical protein